MFNYMVIYHIVLYYIMLYSIVLDSKILCFKISHAADPPSARAHENFFSWARGFKSGKSLRLRVFDLGSTRDPSFLKIHIGLSLKS